MQNPLDKDDEQPATTNVGLDCASPPRGGRLTVLAVCDEWSPHRGGISQFNRKLCITLSQIGHDVTCAVERASPADHVDATTYGINLEVPMVAPGIINLHAPLRTRRTFDAVIGHDLISGPQATFHAVTQRAAAAQRGAPILIQIVHTCPDETGPYAEVNNWSDRTQAAYSDLQKLCSQADIVCAPGPLVARKAGTMLDDGYGAGQAVLRLDPGPEKGPVKQQRVPGLEPICLFVGRAESSAVKGLDIAADAVFNVRERGADLAKTVLWIRGAPAGQSGNVYDAVTAGVGRGHIVVRDYSPLPTAVEGDLLKASVLLMPSRAEGFGLVALEALSMGTPVLVSSRSGLAELMGEVAGGEADQFIIDVRDDSSDVTRWAEGLESVLRDRPYAFRHAEAFARRFSQTCNWESVAEQLCQKIRAVML